MDIELVRGTQGAFAFSALDGAGAPLNLAAKTLSFSAAADRGAGPDVGPIALTVVDEELGTALLTIDAADVPAGSGYEALAFEVTLDDGGSDPVVIETGILYLLPAIGTAAP